MTLKLHDQVLKTVNTFTVYKATSVTWENSPACLNSLLLYISKVHGMPCSHTKFQNVDIAISHATLIKRYSSNATKVSIQ